jgi:hypothetical protein
LSTALAKELPAGGRSRRYVNVNVEGDFHATASITSLIVAPLWNARDDAIALVE